MSKAISSQTNTRAGLCPHGLPPAACPICSGGAAGSSGIRNTRTTKPIKNNQWSWMKCYAVGMAMKAQENRIKESKNVFEKQIEFAKKLNQNIQNISDKINNTIKAIQHNSPLFVQNIIQILSKFMINPFLNIISKLPQIIEKLVSLQQNISNFIINISEKLIAIMGDIKNFINRTFIENLKKKAKKIFSFFTSNIEDENYKNDETLAVFKAREMKKYIIKILKEAKKRSKNAN